MSNVDIFSCHNGSERKGKTYTEKEWKEWEREREREWKRDR